MKARPLRSRGSGRRLGALLRPLVLSAALSSAASAQAPGTLTPEVRTSLVFNGVTVTGGGRIFMPFQRQQPGTGMEVGEIVDGQPRAFPDAAWNGWKEGMDARHAFVGVNALRVGPDGALWVVDKGAAAMGADTVPGGPKVVRIDLGTNQVSRVYDLGAVAGGKSFVDDIRFNGRRAYLTDAGRPGLIVLDLDTGEARRVLDRDPSTVAARPLVAEGKPLTDPNGKPVVIHADQLEVSPDGRWFYYQPCSGPMARIETRYLDDPALEDAALRGHVEPFADTGSTGGTAIDASGTIYASDTDRSRILKITPSGQISTLIADPRLVWVDAMWIDDTGGLWIPAAQINRTRAMNGGVDAVAYPTVIYRLPIGAAPVRR